jgi:3-methyladenine DNA glycosylase Tag
LENLMQDARIIRHLGSAQSVPRNASSSSILRQEEGQLRRSDCRLR